MKQSYFAFFNLPESIIIDSTELEEKYIEKQNDNNISDDDKSYANHCYQILKNDIKRFEHFCELKSINFENLNPDQNFLIKFYELNEEIDSMSENDRKIAVKDMKKEIKEIFKKIDELYKQNDLESMIELYLEVKYVNRIVENNC